MTGKIVSFFLLHLVVELTTGLECQGKAASVTKLLYDLLKCEPKYGADKCITAYTCPNDNRPKDTCYFKGNTYQIGQSIDNDLLSEIPRRDCACEEGGEIQCPFMTGHCTEFWVSDYPQPGCYLRRELNQQCASGEICPPFDGNAECKVNEKTYKEGEKFESPDNHCAECVCNKEFNGTFEAPFCQRVNCTWTFFYGGKYLDRFCAPYYKDINKDCCPELELWVCSDPKDEHHPSPVSSENPDLKCKFGDKSMGIGDYLIQNGNIPEAVKCECIVPPYLHCTAAKP